MLVVAVTGSVLLTGMPVTTAAARGSDCAPDEGQVTVRAHTAAGSAIEVMDARFTQDKRRVKATVVWNKALLAKSGSNDRFNLRVVNVSQGKNHKAVVLARWSRRYAGQRSQVRLWLSASQARKARAAKSVVLSVSQQYDSPKNRDKLYEETYVSTIYLKGSPPTEVPELRDCSSVALEPGADLSNCNLLGAKLIRVRLRAANLTGADVRGADLTDADLFGAKLTNAGLRAATLYRTRLMCTDLTNANLFGADLKHAQLTFADLTGADLTGAYMDYASLQLAILTRANLKGAYLRLAGLIKVDLTGANLNNANLYGARMNGANLSGANLGFANMATAKLTGANLSGANLTSATLHGATWTDGRVCATPSVGRCN